MAYEYLNWATDATDGIDPLKVPPPQEIMATGLLRGEPMGRQWFNYILNYLLSRTSGGKTGAANATHVIQIYGAAQPDMLTNGWKLVKTEALPAASGGNLYYYEHVGV